MYQFTADYSEPLTDGSGRYRTLFKAGQVVSWETAYELGLVSTKTEPKQDEAKPDVKAKTEKA